MFKVRPGLFNPKTSNYDSLGALAPQQLSMESRETQDALVNKSTIAIKDGRRGSARRYVAPEDSYESGFYFLPMTR